MSVKWTERRFSKSLQLEEQKDFLARKSSILPSEPLEDMVSCPIHLGILERPIQLPCGHSFCLECIERCLKTQMLQNNHFACPVCRVDWPVPLEGANGWPQSYALNDIITYVQEQKQAKLTHRPSQKYRNGNNYINNRKNSIIEKADIVKKLAEDIANKKLSDGSVDKAFLITELNSILKKLQEPTTPASVGNGGSRRSSFELKIETELTREQMSQLCEYKVAPEKLSLAICQELMKSPTKDSVDLDEDPQFRKLVFVNSSHEIVIYDCNSETSTSFVPMYHNDCLKPVFLRLFQDFVFVSGLINSKEDGSILAGVLVKYSLDGKMIESSDRYAKQNNNYLPVYGFDIDTQGNIYIAQPDIATITMMTPDLKENEDKFVFTEPELHPTFVCYSKHTKEIWASCPAHKSILILDSVTGSYMQFGTVQLFNSEPSHIISTQDNKICFLDSKLSRVFWIKRQNEYLCIQRLAFGAVLKKANFTLLRGFFNSSALLLITDKSVFIAKPHKNSEKPESNAACCVVM